MTQSQTASAFDKNMIDYTDFSKILNSQQLTLDLYQLKHKIGDYISDNGSYIP